MYLAGRLEPEEGWSPSDGVSFAKDRRKLGYDSFTELSFLADQFGERLPGQSVSNGERGTIAELRRADDLAVAGGGLTPHDAGAGRVPVVGEVQSLFDRVVYVAAMDLDPILANGKRSIKSVEKFTVERLGLGTHIRLAVL